MPSAFVLLQCIGKAAVKNVVNLVTFGVGGDILVDAWDYWQKASREEQRAAEVQAVAQMSAAELRDEVARILHEEAAALPAEQQAQVASYLGQVPAAIRRSLRRPSDPSGTTLAAGTVFRQPQDLLPLLPAALPRFKAGDRPRGIGDWELVELLGVGGFGEVWKARNPHMPEPVALKFCLDSKAAEWLRNEAKLLGRIMSQGKHPGIVRLLHTYLSAVTPCLEYEYVDGGDLAGFIQERRNGLSAEQAARWIKGLAEIVGFAHRLDPPIVHRDLKPANILLKSRPDGKVALRITDFGIGALAIQEARAQLRRGSKSGEVLSAAVRGAYTPLYASPQQMHDDKPDPRDDVYALGVIWYQLLTGDLTKGRPGGDKWRERLTDRGMTPAMLALLVSSFEEERKDRPDNAVVLAEKLKRLLPSPVEDIPVVIPVEPVPVEKPRPGPQPQPQRPPTAERVRTPSVTEQKRETQGPKKAAPWSWGCGLLVACSLAGVALTGGFVLLNYSPSATTRSDWQSDNHPMQQSITRFPKETATNKALIESVLNEIGTPPVQVTQEVDLLYDALPSFPAEVMKKYEDDKPNPNSPLRKAVKNARAALWAIYPGQEPKDLSSEVSKMRNEIRARLIEGYRAPGGGNAEKQFKDRVEEDERRVARLMGAMQDALDELEKPAVVEERAKESKRWQANYDFMLARIQLEYAFLFEYQSMLGSMRKEFPPRDPALHGGWKLASQPNLQGDSVGKKLASRAKKLFDKIAKDNAGTPWEVLAKREMLTNLGLEWQAAP